MIAWEEPPRRRERDIWARVTDELRTRPGEWARVAEGVTTNYAHHSILRCLRQQGCQVCYRTEHGQVTVWARYVEVS